MKISTALLIFIYVACLVATPLAAPVSGEEKDHPVQTFLAVATPLVIASVLFAGRDYNAVYLKSNRPALIDARTVDDQNNV
ncbi:hypothetical protein RRG08_001384 [Elysia crispata]|uniref:Uncharacterized protein n=1 Tax=Elysia crispata TaxID=231223 RepID=A0AAE1DK39_9GAST|nr:hypothetical protein RRG08_001384 [Elysia crispata]